MANLVGPSISHSQGYKMASAMPADSSENLQLFKRNDGQEPVTITRDHSLQSNIGTKIVQELFFL